MPNQNSQTNQENKLNKNIREFPEMQSPNPKERDARDLQAQDKMPQGPNERKSSEVGEGEDYDEDMLDNDEEKN